MNVCHLFVKMHEKNSILWNNMIREEFKVAKFAFDQCYECIWLFPRFRQREGGMVSNKVFFYIHVHFLLCERFRLTPME